MKPKYEIQHLVRVADLRKTFSKRDTTNWSYKLYEITETVNDTIPSYRIDDLPEIYNEALLKKNKVNIERERWCLEKINYHLD